MLNRKVGKRPSRVVVIGGGTGIYPVLRGFRDQGIYTTAICTAFDSGGSTGKLKRLYEKKKKTIIHGDLRNAFAALSRLSDDHTLRAFLNTRLTEGYFSGHVTGNILLAVGAEQGWDVDETLERWCIQFDLFGKALPVSLDRADLCAELSDGEIICGESNIDTRSTDDTRTIQRVFLEPEAKPYPPVLEAIADAELIVIGPGDLYTSIIPNLLVHGIKEAIEQSRAYIVVPSQLMTKHSETRDYDIADFADELVSYGLGDWGIHAVVCNNAPIPEQFKRHYYAVDKAQPVEISDRAIDRIQNRAAIVHQADLLSENGLNEGRIRHDPEKTVRALLSVFTELTIGGAL